MRGDDGWPVESEPHRFSAPEFTPVDCRGDGGGHGRFSFQLPLAAAVDLG